MKGSYFQPFGGAAVAAIALLLWTRALESGNPNAPVPIVVGVGTLPLVVYHLLLIRRLRNGGLPQGAVDSVYYLGFLITLASIAIAAYDARAAATSAPQLILGRFAVGLIATGYALFARIHLQATAPEAEDADAAQAAMEAAQHWREVSAAAAVTLDDVRRSHAVGVEANRRDLQAIRGDMHEALSTILATVQSEITGVVRSVAQELRDARLALLPNELLETQRQLVAGLGESQEALAEVNKAFTSLSRRLGTTTSAIDEAAQAAQTLSALGAGQAEHQERVAAAVRDTEEVVTRLKGALQELAGAVSSQARALPPLLKDSTQGLHILIAERERAATEAMRHFEEGLTASLRQFSDTGAQVDRTNETLSTSLQSLRRSADATAAAAQAFSDGLVRAVNQIVESTTRGQAEQ